MSSYFRKGLIVLVAACLFVAFMPALSQDGQVLAKSKTPAKVKGLTISVSGTSLTAKWKKAKKAKKYQVNVQVKKGKKWKKFKTLKTKDLSAKFTGKTGKTYRVRVRGISGKKKGKWSAWKKAKARANTKSKESKESKEESEEGAAYDLEYWTKGSKVAQSIRDYVKDVSDPKSKNFVPEADRIATFDMDGTFIGELYPTYFDTCMFVYRVLEDPSYKDKASDELKTIATTIREEMDNGTINDSSKYGTKELAQAFAKSYAGMTMKEYEAYVTEFKKHKCEGFDNLTYETSFYKPMVSVIRYLAENNFRVYVVSGTERMTIRALIAGNEDLRNAVPTEQIIGSDFTLKGSNQGDTDGLDYTLNAGEDVQMGDDLIVKNLKMNKVSAITREIGKPPILSFGNTTGDSAMAQYALNNGKYKGKAYMLLCDDTDRDYGRLDKARSFKEHCDGRGFTTVSMKNDFATIYGDNVKKNAKGCSWAETYEKGKAGSSSTEQKKAA